MPGWMIVLAVGVLLLLIAGFTVSEYRRVRWQFTERKDMLRD